MKFESFTDKFAKAFSKIEKIAGKGSVNPILKCVMIEAKDSSLVLKATNLDIGIEVSLPAKIESEGVVVTTSSALGSFISQLSKEKVLKFEKKEELLSVVSERFSASFKLLSSEEFPIIPRVSKEKGFSVDSRDFVKGLKSVFYSASISTIKPELASVYIYPEGETVVFVATDSFRLAEKKIKVKSKLDFEQILIPFKNVSDIIRILEEEEGQVRVLFDKNQISFCTDDLYLISRVVDSSFPAYKQIVPKESKTEAVVLKQDFLNALKVSHVFSDSFHRVTFSISPKEKKFEILTKNSEVGENTSNFSGALTGEDIQISFNYKNIYDCFQSIDSDSVSLSFDGLTKPLVIKGVNDPSFFYLAMPMNK